jgi:hypothetical protein
MMKETPMEPRSNSPAEIYIGESPIVNHTGLKVVNLAEKTQTHPDLRSTVSTEVSRHQSIGLTESYENFRLAVYDDITR